MTDTDLDTRLTRIEAVLERLLSEKKGIDGYVTVEDAARISSLTAPTLRRAIRSNKLRASNVSLNPGRPTWRILRTDLDHFLQTISTSVDKPLDGYQSKHFPKLTRKEKKKAEPTPVVEPVEQSEPSEETPA